MTLANKTCLLAVLAASSALMSGCVVLYMPYTYYIPQTSVLVSPFKYVSTGYDTNASDAPLSISLGDPDSSKLRNLRFANATMTSEDGVVTQLSLRREILENPNSFVMYFYKANYLGRDLRFHITVLSNGEAIVVTFQTRFKSKVVWPKDSDYSG